MASRSADLAGERPVEPGSVLRSITARRPDGTPDVIDEPLIPLLDTTLLTNAPGEPRVGSQVLAEVAYRPDRIDVDGRTSVAAASVRCSMRCAATASASLEMLANRCRCGMLALWTIERGAARLFVRAPIAWGDPDLRGVLTRPRAS